MNKKINILVIPSDRTGVSFFRSTKPHISLEQNHPEFSVDIVYTTDINFNNLDFFDKYDIIHYHKTIVNYEDMEKFVNELRRKGIVTIMDIDDHWSPRPHHPAHQIIKANKLDIKLRDNLKHPDYVMTTTEIFADEIRKYNKNVVVVPNAIDPKDRQFIAKPEKSDRVRIGWLGGSCMTPDTEILTNEGWKRFDDLNQTETVATLNPKSNELEYHKPTGYICEPFDGELNCAKNGLVEYEVTPNHNMYASVAKNLTHKKMDLKLIQSSKIHGENFHVKKDSIWIGKNKDFMKIPAMVEEEELVSELINEYSIIDSNSKRKNYLLEKYGNDKFLDMDKWLQFFGFWMAEGWTSKTDGLYQVGVSQVKDNNHLETIYKLLMDLGYKPTYTKDGNQVRVFDKQLWSYLRQFGNAYDKYIPKEILELSSRQLNIFLEWFIKGDGHIEDNKYKRTRAFTSSPLLANDLQEMALKLGISATITNRGKKTSYIKGRKIINQEDSLVINFTKHPNVSKHNKNTPLVKSEDQYKRHYKGNVYCVEVQNHIIYVRRNGKPFWVGNSHLYDLQILNGVVNKIKAAGLLDKVQFVLCGFDIRGIMKEQGPDGKITERPIKPEETVWTKYEAIFTDNYSTVSPEYKEHLMKYEKREFKGIENEPYRRVWTKPVTSYATNYNLFDISLAPIEENNFNRVKSQLKIIEAGFHKKAIICQDFGPYTIDTINSYEKGGEYNENGNALMVDSSKNHKLWFKFIKELVENENLRNKLSENLHNTVKDKFSLVTTAKMRADFYKEILEKK